MCVCVCVCVCAIHDAILILGNPYPVLMCSIKLLKQGTDS